MSAQRSELRRVKTAAGDIGYFHCWTNVLESPNDTLSYPVKQGVIEFKDGTMSTIEPQHFSFIAESSMDRKMAETE